MAAVVRLSPPYDACLRVYLGLLQDHFTGEAGSSEGSPLSRMSSLLIPPSWSDKYPSGIGYEKILLALQRGLERLPLAQQAGLSPRWLGKKSRRGGGVLKLRDLVNDLHRALDRNGDHLELRRGGPPPSSGSYYRFRHGCSMRTLMERYAPHKHACGAWCPMEGVHMVNKKKPEAGAEDPATKSSDEEDEEDEEKEEEEESGQDPLPIQMLLDEARSDLSSLASRFDRIEREAKRRRTSHELPRRQWADWHAQAVAYYEKVEGVRKAFKMVGINFDATDGGAALQAPPTLPPLGDEDDEADSEGHAKERLVALSGGGGGEKPPSAPAKAF